MTSTNYSLAAGLLPSQDALFMESKDSPYANLVVVRKGFEHDPRLQKFLTALHSDTVKQKAQELFQREAILAW